MSSRSRFFAAAAVALLVSIGSAGFLAARRSHSRTSASSITVGPESAPTASPVADATPVVESAPVQPSAALRAAAHTAPKTRTSQPAPARPARTAAVDRAAVEADAARPSAVPQPVVDTPPPVAPAPKPTPEPAPAAPVVETAPVEAPKPRFEELTVKADAVVGIRLDQALSSATAKLEDRVTASVSRDVMVDGRTVVPAGTRLEGHVTLVQPGSKFKGRARLGIRFHTLVLADGLRVPVQTEALFRDGDSATRSTATKVGTGAAAGAILGAVLGGKRGAILGAGAGAGGGTVAVMAGDAKEAELDSGTQLTMRLTSPVTVTIERE